MRIAFILSALLLTTIVSTAQDGATWKVTVSKKNILTASNADDTLTNTVRLKKADLSNNGIFKIEYIEPKNSATKGWIRHIAIYDTNSNAMTQLDSTSIIQFYNRDLLKLLWSRKKLIAYTWSNPADPGMAAAIRIRRFRLCSIELVD